MVEDQRFASSRPDVLTFESDELEEGLTIAGPIEVELYVSTSGTDSDWIVKLIDVYPDTTINPMDNQNKIEMGGYQMLIRAEIMRGKFRNSLENPEPFIPNNVTKIKFGMNDIFHTLLNGHKLMIQIQSSWFPLFDRNPQIFCNIYEADEEDFKKATQRVYHTVKYPSKVVIKVLNEAKE
jgi:putative CocE/NonD family hydrolase